MTLEEIEKLHLEIIHGSVNGERLDNLFAYIRKMALVIETAESFEYNFEALDAFENGVEVPSSCQCCANNQSLMADLIKTLKTLRGQE